MHLVQRSTGPTNVLGDQPRTLSPIQYTPTTAPIGPTTSNSFSSSQVSDIAPWDEPPTPPPKSSRGFGFPSKASFSNFGSVRHGSANSLFRHPRKSDSRSTFSTEEKRQSDDGDSNYRLLSSASSATLGPPQELRKSKSSIFHKLTRSRSRSGLRADSINDSHPSLKPPPPPLPDAFATPFIPSLPPPPTISSPPSTLSKRDKREKKKNSGPTPPPKVEVEKPMISLADIENMDGIVDTSQLAGPSQEASSPSSGFDSSTDHSSFFHNPISLSEFRNPFKYSPTPVAAKRNGFIAKDNQYVSPKDISGLPGYSDGRPLPRLQYGDPGSVSWTAPESWVVGNPGSVDVSAVEAEYSSSDDSVAHGDVGRMSFAVNADNETLTQHILALPPGAITQPTEDVARKVRKRKKKGRPFEKSFKIRVYTEDGQYHQVTLSTRTTVADLLEEWKVKEKKSETHNLYIRERGRERIMGDGERPANIVRKRLEQAGYDPIDIATVLSSNESLSFLLKLTYKSQLLGPSVDVTFEAFEHVELTDRGLRTIPVFLHQHADQIASLTLSCNPMLDIPLDFIQSCTNLRDLRLSKMAMKKVPQSIRHSTSLRRLDLSSNRIADLEEAFLDHIIGLSILLIQNNRMQSLPWYFPRLRTLATLNISNNKFRVVPNVVCQLEALRDLDISFNTISELPEEIGHLRYLERLVIVGNSISRFPVQCSQLVSLRVLDCRRNRILDLSVMSMLPQLHTLSADHNAVHGLSLSIGPCLAILDASFNEITQIILVPGPVGRLPSALTSLDISHAKLSTLDDTTLSQLTSLRRLRLDYNTFRVIPETLGDLTFLEFLSCSDNQLVALPTSIGRLQRLEVLDVHNNNIRELPVTLWNCASLTKLNVTSNLISTWHDPPIIPSTDASSVVSETLSPPGVGVQRKPSTTSLGTNAGTGRVLPPLVYSLELLYLGENDLTDDTIHPIMLFKELRVLNMSFNELQDLPSRFFGRMTILEELYLSGNKLTSIPTEDLFRLKRLRTLYLNGNKLQTLPQELGKVQNLMVLDVGSNVLKYNVNNWEFDWNWNFNKNLKYLNLSGNTRLQIKADPSKNLVGRRQSVTRMAAGQQSLSGFTDLSQLRVLGLMDVTTGMNATVDIPDESDERRVRTSSSTVLNMAYGIADTLGKNDYLTMLDLVHEFREKGEAIFAMFGRSHPPKSLPPGSNPNTVARYIRDRFVLTLMNELKSVGSNNYMNEGKSDALRRTFLKLNYNLHNAISNARNNPSARKMSTSSGLGLNGTVGPDFATLRSGAAGVVVYFVGRTMYVANVGNALAVVSRSGAANLLSCKHDPFDHAEIARIRAAEGWVSPPGLVNDEVDISRGFGFIQHLPVINARPDVITYQISPQDDLLIIANQGLWDVVSYQTAVDVARTEKSPMIAAQKLRDFAISYGAEGSTMIMVIGLGGTQDETDIPKKKTQILHRGIARLDEVPPPVGHIALVFSDIRNSTHLWEANPGMPTAHKIHNVLLRRLLRLCGGYEVKTEGDAFMCSFPTSLAAVWYCLSVQQQLLNEAWPLEILECEDGMPIFDSGGSLLARGLSVRMGIHCGFPSPEPDPITHRMDYFGSMVNRSARICGDAAGGQIKCSAEIMREIYATVLRTGPETEYSSVQPQQAIDGIQEMGIDIVPVGDVKLKGLEVPENISIIYPLLLARRQEWGPTGPTASASRVAFSVEQMRELGLICLRLETLTTSRIFRTFPERKASMQTVSIENEPPAPQPSLALYGDPNVLLPPMTAQTTDAELMSLLDSLAARIVNAIATLEKMYLPEPQTQLSPSLDKETVMSALTRNGGLDERTLDHIMSVLSSLS